VTNYGDHAREEMLTFHLNHPRDGVDDDGKAQSNQEDCIDERTEGFHAHPAKRVVRRRALSKLRKPCVQSVREIVFCQQ
jgi:hypothetical protein